MGGGDQRRGSTTVPDGAAPIPTASSLEQQYKGRIAPEPQPTPESAGHEAAAYHAGPRPAPAPHRAPNVIVAPPVETPVPRREVTTVVLPLERVRAWWVAIPVLLVVALGVWGWRRATAYQPGTAASASASATAPTSATATATASATATAPATASATTTALASTSAPASTLPATTHTPATTSAHAASPPSAAPSGSVDPHPKSHLLSPE